MISAAALRRRPANLASLLLGAAAAAVITAAVTAPILIGLLGAAAVFVLAFVEFGPLLVAVVCLLPIDVALKSDAFRNVPLAFNTVVMAGYLLGRLGHWKERLAGVRQAITATTALFLGALTISLIFGEARQTHAAVRGISFVASYFVLYLVFLMWADRQCRKRHVVAAVLASSLAVSVFALVQKAAGDYTPVWHALHPDPDTDLSMESLGRVASFLGHPNHLAGYLIMVLPVAIGCCLLGHTRRWKLLGGATALLCLAALVLTQSRGGYLGMVAVLVITVWHFVKRRKLRFAVLISFILTGAGAYALMQLWNPAHFSDIGSDLSLWIRFVLWYTAWNLFLSSPIHGVGYGAFALISDQYLPAIKQLSGGLGVHNIYLSLLAETGVLGLAAFLSVMCAAGIEARRQLRSEDWLARVVSFGVLAGTAGIMVAALLDHYFLGAVQTGYLYWLLLAVLASNSRKPLSGGVHPGGLQ